MAGSPLVAVTDSVGLLVCTLRRSPGRAFSYLLLDFMMDEVQEARGRKGRREALCERRMLRGRWLSIHPKSGVSYVLAISSVFIFL